MSDEITAYDFVQFGERLADSLTRAAEEQVARAQQILDQTKSMADIIRTQVAAQAKQIEEMHVRFKAFGEQMLDAHRILNGNPVIGRVERLDNQGAGESRLMDLEPLPPIPIPSGDLDDLRTAVARSRNRRNNPGLGTIDPDLTTDPKQGSARDEFPRAVATGEPSAPWAGYSHYYSDKTNGPVAPGTDDSGERRTAATAAGQARESSDTKEHRHLRATRPEKD